MKLFFQTILIFVFPAIGFCQDYYSGFEFSKKDSIRGQLLLNRSCYDVVHYDLFMDINTETKTINGSNEINFLYVEQSSEIQIDLFDNLVVEKIIVDGDTVAGVHTNNAIFLPIPQWELGSKHQIKVHYSGQPQIAINAPWDGGFTWDYDSYNKPFVGVSCEGIGASLWWPNKDHLSDEPDSMDIRVLVPSDLMAVCNGNLISSKEFDRQTEYHWHVSYPINNYNVTVNVADYVHFHDDYISGSDTLDLDYYVLRENLKKAQTHFKQVHGVLEAFENFFGPYPFWEDGFALVETPYLGMEHQGAIAYGNKYMRGYLGRMIPRDMDWDYIIVHETGHEYFGNSVSIEDMCDMWIHESFTTYMEALYVEYHYDRNAVDRYLELFRFHENELPIIGPRDVNFEDWGHSDHYFKGSWILHTIRSIYNQDSLWFQSLKDLYDRFEVSTTNSDELLDFMDQQFQDFKGEDYTLMPILNQYLRHPKIPVFHYSLKKQKNQLVVKCKWEVDEQDFQMPINVGNSTDWQTILVGDEWVEYEIENLEMLDFSVDTKGFLIDVEEHK